MYEAKIRIEEAAPLSDLEDDGVAVVRGLVFGLAISAALWLVLLSAWLLLR